MKTTLDLNKCPFHILDDLPDGMQIRGDLNFSRAPVWLPKPSKLPSNLKVSGTLNLMRRNIDKIPRDLVAYSLDLSGCFSIRSLPENLRVAKDLLLWGCISLKSLPKGLKVGSNLSIMGCDELGIIPEDVMVGGWISRDYETKAKLFDFPIHLRKKILR